MIASLALGRLYDRIGIPTILVAVFLSSLFAPLVFLGDFSGLLIGMVLWGVGYATQDTLLKALVASVLPEGQRNLAFGLFYAGYGVGWLMGSVGMGLPYDHSAPHSLSSPCWPSLCHCRFSLPQKNGGAFVISTVTRNLLIAATLVGGLLAGADVDRALVAMRAWQQVGPEAWAAFCQHADLGNGLVLYRVEAFGGAF